MAVLLARFPLWRGTNSVDYLCDARGGLGIGGPQGIFGWAMLALFISLSILVW